MLILKSTSVRQVFPYVGFNENVNYSAIIIRDGKIVTGRIIGQVCSDEIKIISDYAQYIVKEKDILGIIKSDISVGDVLEILNI